MCHDLTSLSDTRNLNYKSRLSALLWLRQICFEEMGHWKMLCKDKKGNFKCDLWLGTLWFDIFQRQWALLVIVSVSAPCFSQPDSSAPRSSFLSSRRKEISVWRLNGQTLSSTKPICLAYSLSLFSVTQRLKPRWGANPGTLNGFSFPPLNLGNAETGYLTQANLLSIARRVGADWQTIGLNLGLTYQQIERIGYNNR